MSAGARLERSTGGAHAFHHRPLELDDEQPAVWIHEVDRPALVLGSSQSIDIVDTAAVDTAGWELTRRRSGGGIVTVERGRSCWIDVLLPRTHARWSDDVNRAFLWVGEWWCRALTGLGLDGLEVYDGPITNREFGRAVCFAGVGPGEVVQRRDGKIYKVVGLSQRRTRDAARFQGLYLRGWNPDPIERFVRPDAMPAGLKLGSVAAGAATDAPAAVDVADAFVGWLDQAVGV